MGLIFKQTVKQLALEIAPAIALSIAVICAMLGLNQLTLDEVKEQDRVMATAQTTIDISDLTEQQQKDIHALIRQMRDDNEYYAKQEEKENGL